MAGQTNALIERAERRAQQERPATLIYNGQEFPCVAGNHRFWQDLKMGGGGFQTFNNQPIRILRKDLFITNPDGTRTAVDFKGGQHGQEVTIRNDDPGSVGYGEEIDLIVGVHHSGQPLVLCLNIESIAA